MTSVRRRSRGLLAFASLLLLIVAACSEDASPTEEDTAGAAALGGAGAGSGGPAGASGQPTPRPSACAAPIEPRAPRSIAEVIAMLNAMPKPISLPCFVESLARPLSMQTTYSVLSAQPAVGKRSPRVFVFFDTLIASVVPDGVGRQLLEFGERRGETHSLKGELEFPITTELDAASPFTRLRYDDRLSTCDFCHADPSPEPDLAIPYAIVSQAMRPLTRERVPVEMLIAESEACDDTKEPERCAMLRALAGGDQPPSEGEFPATYRTFVP